MAKYYTPEEVAAELRVTRRTVYEWLKSGRLNGLRVGRGWRIRPEAIEAALKSAPSPGNSTLSAEERAARVKAIVGKYAWVPGSVDDFIREKQEEIERENRRWGDLGE